MENAVRPSPMKVCSYRDYGYFYWDFHLLIEIYPLVPFPPSVRKQEAVYRLWVRAWGPVTSARTRAGDSLVIHLRAHVRAFRASFRMDCDRRVYARMHACEMRHDN